MKKLNRWNQSREPSRIVSSQRYRRASRHRKCQGDESALEITDQTSEARGISASGKEKRWMIVDAGDESCDNTVNHAESLNNGAVIFEMHDVALTIEIIRTARMAEGGKEHGG